MEKMLEEIQRSASTSCSKRLCNGKASTGCSKLSAKAHFVRSDGMRFPAILGATPKAGKLRRLYIDLIKLKRLYIGLAKNIEKTAPQFKETLHNSVS